MLDASHLDFASVVHVLQRENNIIDGIHDFAVAADGVAEIRCVHLHGDASVGRLDGSGIWRGQSMDAQAHE